MLSVGSTQRGDLMTWADPFSAWTNLLMCVAVSCFGAYWVHEFRRTPGNYRYRTYVLWWASWLAWDAAWLLLTLQAHELLRPSITLSSVVSLLDNINVMFLILTYFALTRGSAYTTRDAISSLKRLLASLAIALLAAYGGALLLDWKSGAQLAYLFHNAWSISLAILGPILVGWACYLRFNTRVVLIVAFAYGFMQPSVYATQLVSSADPLLEPVLVKAKPVIAMLIALFKLLWAVASTRVLSGAPGNGASLVHPAHTKTFHLFSGWRRSVALHAVLLLFIYLVLAVTAVYNFAREKDNTLAQFGVALGTITGVLAAWGWLWNVYRELTREASQQRAAADGAARRS
jgi:hypothetical protein